MTSIDPIEEVRTRRIAETWRAGVPSEDEVNRGRWRLGRHPALARRSSARVWVAMIVQGFVLGIAALSPAAWLAEHRLGLGRAETPASEPGAPKATPRTGARRERPTAQVPPATPTELPASVDVTKSTPTPNAETGLEHGHTELARDVMAPGTPSVATLPLAPTPDLPSSSGPWARVAEALATGDWRRADAALVELGRSADPTTRDAADLARAEIGLEHGRDAAFRSTVERLARTGTTALVRKRASALLQRMGG